MNIGVFRVVFRALGLLGLTLSLLASCLQPPAAQAVTDNPGTATTVEAAADSPVDPSDQGPIPCPFTTAEMNAEWFTQNVPDYCGRSRNLFPEPAPTTIVVDHGKFMDRPVFKDEGMIRIPIDVRYVIPDIINHPGDKGKKTAAIANGYLSRTATLAIAYSDIDNAAPIIKCGAEWIKVAAEKNKIFFNGKPVFTTPTLSKKFTYLEGAHGEWTVHGNVDDFRKSKRGNRKPRLEAPLIIKTEDINFPQTEEEASNGSILNYLTIEVDVDNKDKKCSKIWSTEVDWAALSFKAADPIHFVHGINPGNGENPAINYWNAFYGETNKRGIPAIWPPIFMTQDRFFPNERPDCDEVNPRYKTISRHVGELEIFFKERLPNYGTNRINIIAHSKGGLDSREFIDKMIDPEKSNKRKEAVMRFGINFASMSRIQGGFHQISRRLVVNSYFTLNTPFLGSPLGDWQIQGQNDGFGLDVTLSIIHSQTAGDFSCDLSVARASKYTQESYNNREKGMELLPKRRIVGTHHPINEIPQSILVATPNVLFLKTASIKILHPLYPGKTVGQTFLCGDMEDTGVAIVCKSDLIVPTWSSQAAAFPPVSHIRYAQTSITADHVLVNQKPEIFDLLEKWSYWKP
jgi:hypothetical protein